MSSFQNTINHQNFMKAASMDESRLDLKEDEKDNGNESPNKFQDHNESIEVESYRAHNPSILVQ